MLSMDIFNNDYSKEPFFFLDAVGVVWLCCPGLCSGRKSPRPRGTGRLAHPPSGAALLSHSRCQAAQLSRADSCLPPSLLSHLQSELLRLPDLTLPICKEQHMELGLQSCKVAFQGKLERKATLTDPELGSETARPKCWAVVSSKWQTCAKMLHSMASWFLNRIPQPANPGGRRGWPRSAVQFTLPRAVAKSSLPAFTANPYIYRITLASCSWG